MDAARNGDVMIAYETFGPPDGAPLLLISGTGVADADLARGLLRGPGRVAASGSPGSTTATRGFPRT